MSLLTADAGVGPSVASPAASAASAPIHLGEIRQELYGLMQQAAEGQERLVRDLEAAHARAEESAAAGLRERRRERRVWIALVLIISLTLGVFLWLVYEGSVGRQLLNERDAYLLEMAREVAAQGGG